MFLVPLQPFHFTDYIKLISLPSISNQFTNTFPLPLDTNSVLPMRFAERRWGRR